MKANMVLILDGTVTAEFTAKSGGLFTVSFSTSFHEESSKSKRFAKDPERQKTILEEQTFRSLKVDRKPQSDDTAPSIAFINGPDSPPSKWPILQSGPI